MLNIRRALVDAMVAHAAEDHPVECCGVISGPAGTDRPERLVRLSNDAASTTFFRFASADLLALYRGMDERDEEPVVMYHSHTGSGPYPSATDVEYASEPGAHYVIVSTRHGPGREEVRSYRIVDSRVVPEEITTWGA